MPPGMKLKLSTGPKDNSAQSTQPQTPATPSIKFKLGGNSSSTPAPATFAVPPPPKTAKLNTKKRQRDDGDDKTTTQASPAKKRPSIGHTIKLQGLGKINSATAESPIPQTPQTASTTRFTISGFKPTKSVPVRPLGVGYDSEAEDAEEDPAIEENLILRMQPGPDCDYLQEALKHRRIGPGQGMAEVYMRFFQGNKRRAAVVIRGTPYAAVIVDLPCIVESMKSWDKRGWWKCADICQMLLVYAAVDSEYAAETAPLPREIDQKTWQWPHGLTPPMQNVRKRRFRKRVSYRTIELADEEVERLLKQDQLANDSGGSTTANIVNYDALRNDDLEEEEEYEEGGEYEGEQYQDEYEEEEEVVEDAEALAARLQLELEGHDDDGEIFDDAIVAQTTELPGADTLAPPTPAEQEESPSAAEQGDSGSESEEDEVEEAEVDEEEREKAQELAQQREEIEHMRNQLAMFKANRDSTQGAFMRQRWQKRVEGTELDIASKLRAIGDKEDGDDDDNE